MNSDLFRGKDGLSQGAYDIRIDLRLGARPHRQPFCFGQGLKVLALGRHDGLNIKARQAEQALVGHELNDDVIAEAARLAAAASEPKDDNRGSAAYKKDVVRVYVQRGLKAALARAQEVKA